MGSVESTCRPSRNSFACTVDRGWGLASSSALYKTQANVKSVPAAYLRFTGFVVTWGSPALVTVAFADSGALMVRILLGICHDKKIPERASSFFVRSGTFTTCPADPTRDEARSRAATRS